MRPSIALVVGNGLTKDLFHRSEDLSLDSSQPFSFQFEVPFHSGVSWQIAFPKLFAALNEVRSSQPDIDDFKAFTALIPYPHPAEMNVETLLQNSEILALDDEARQFLAFAYSSLQVEMDQLDKEATPWTDWLRRHRSFLSGAVSFNYDLLFEDLARLAGLIPRSFGVVHVGSPRAVIPSSSGVDLTFNFEEDLRRLGVIQDRPIVLLKPHGSIDFASSSKNIGMPTRTYPANYHATLNDTPLMRIPRNRLGDPRQEAYIVLPTEYSPYRNFQWVTTGYEWFANIANSITHCVFLGLSYWEADRSELNFILNALPKTTEIVEANPYPPNDFRLRVESSGHRYVHWEGDPLPITDALM